MNSAIEAVPSKSEIHEYSGDNVHEIPKKIMFDKSEIHKYSGDNVHEFPKKIMFDMNISFKTIEFQKFCDELKEFSDRVEITFTRNKMKQLSDYVEIVCTCSRIMFTCMTADNSYTFSKTFFNKSDVEMKSLYPEQAIMIHYFVDLNHIISLGKCANLYTEMQLFLISGYSHLNPLHIHFSKTIDTSNKMLIMFSPIDHDIIRKLFKSKKDVINK
jgi:hypothetical protein